MIRAIRRTQAAAFTLIELLVVVAIIAILLAILLPSLQQARKQAKATVCMSNMRQLSMGAFTYATEYGAYPPSLANYANSPSQEVRNRRWEAGVDWLGVGDQGGGFVPGDPNDPDTGNPRGFSAAPKYGILFPYVRQEEVFLCPDDPPGEMDPDSLLGGGGNGKFSYTMFAMLGLRPPEKIPGRLEDKTSGASRGAAPARRRLRPPPLAEVPLFVEEHPKGTNNRGSQGHMEGNFNFETDFVVSRHPPFEQRMGVDPRSGQRRTFEQGATNIGFADGHVDPVEVNFGYFRNDVVPTAAGGNGLDGIPYTAEGLLYYYGVEYDEGYIVVIK
jgi:prepilin-type N-terminal cleavage/methylation domain-containing protein/prepilin-type processing-associated H-X9-DG protein